ncbi:uncharacterized protein LOC105398199 [Plutella xylostella]|uniref:uncharacterized protein LOC105398199 n=1 Tax=Plutella xylostella TaxID=51655 RepID=UPI002032A46A|nr:uncharacterized protein LOC105398199 [Plutella xylostella]
MAPPNDGWTEELSIRLIREFKARPMLWDKSHNLFYKPQTKMEIWEEIGAIIGMPAKACKHKMSILMSSLRREKCKLRRLSNGKPYKYVSRWFAFKELSFLWSNSADYSSYLNESGENEEINLEKRELDTGTDLILVEGMRCEQEPGMEYEQIKYEVVSDDEDYQIGSPMSGHTMPIEAQVTPKPSTSADEDVEIKAFTEFIAAKLRKYDVKTKNTLQRQICNIIFEADQQNGN